MLQLVLKIKLGHILHIWKEAKGYHHCASYPLRQISQQRKDNNMQHNKTPPNPPK
jgi:hypothetical protein